MQSIISGRSLRELLELVNNYSNNWAGLLAVLAIIAPVIIEILLAVVKMLFKKIHSVIPSERMNCIRYIDANSSVEHRKELCRYYIPTRAQDIDPCNQEEIRDNNGKFLSIPLCDFFLNEAFKTSSRGKHYLILADSGMGKTTLLLQLYLRSAPLVRFRKSAKTAFVPLGQPNCIDEIGKIANPENTILLLDGLDENPDAMFEFDAFFKRLIHNTSRFNKVVITCRTQFFASGKDEPFQTGLVQIGGSTKGSEIVKKYLSPFSDEEDRKYLKKRFAFNRRLQKKALAIVQKVPEIMVRPLILNWISFLCDTKEEYKYLIDIYDSIIEKWIEREDLGSGSDKLYELSVEIAQHMFLNKSTDIPAKEVEKIASRKHINIQPIVAKSRSVLNRNSNGVFKFAHRSFFEFLVVFDILSKHCLPSDTEYLWSFSGAKRFLFESLLNSAEITNKKQVEDATQQLVQSKALVQSGNLIDFLLQPKLQIHGENTERGFIVEVWQYYLPIEGYNRKDEFNVTRFSSIVDVPVHEIINSDGIDIGLVFEVSAKCNPPQTKISTNIIKRSVKIKM